MKKFIFGIIAVMIVCIVIVALLEKEKNDDVYTKNGPPWYATFLADEKRWRDLLVAKVRLLSQTAKCFLRESA